MRRCPDDETLVALVEHLLPAARLVELESHVDGCQHCRQVIASLATAAVSPLAAGTLPRAAATPDLERGTPIGERYRIERPLGRGGMGTVYLARDLTLGRDVAVKVHRAPTGHERLYQEALAMARLAHPNVVNVFEIGVVDGRRFVAMEYVRGGTSREWLGKPRTWQEIVALFAEAGEGIAAAHRAGLVHRDFKPENVLVGDDGRPRVSDFGLVQQQGDSAPVPDTPALASLTETGTIVGTPAYMAPEQLDGSTVDGRCDQFAFCVTVWEALYKTRPYAGATTTEIQASIARRELRPNTRGEVPARVRRVLERGLCGEPRDRFPDMPALLAALRRAARPRTWLRVVLGLGVLAAIAGGGLVTRSALTERRHEAVCAGQARGVRELFGAEAHTAVASAFAATHVSFATSAAEHAGVVLDRYADTLAQRTRAACQADTSGPIGAARERCLHDRAAELSHLVRKLEHPDRDIVANAPASAWSLDDPAPCDDSRVLLATPLPRDPEQREPLADARIDELTGRFKDGIARIQPIVAAAHARGDRIGELAALRILMEMHLHAGPPDQAKQDARSQLALAESLGDDQSAAAALAGLASVAATADRDFAEAHRDIELARAKLARLGGGDRHLAAILLSIEGEVLGAELRPADAEATMRRASALMEQIYGPDHPQVARTLGTLAQSLMGQGHAADALPLLSRTLDIFQRAFGDDHYEVAGTLQTRAQALVELGRFDEARADLTRADTIVVRVMGENHPMRGGIAYALGKVEMGSKHWPDALATFRRMLAIYEKSYGPDSGYAASCRRDIADALEELGRYADALAENQRGLATFEHILAKDDPELAPSLEGVAKDLVALHRAGEAVPLIERAIELDSKTGGDPAVVAEDRKILAAARAAQRHQ